MGLDWIGWYSGGVRYRAPYGANTTSDRTDWTLGAILKPIFKGSCDKRKFSGYEQFQQQSMGGFGQETGYEPSADELIDVLK